MKRQRLVATIGLVLIILSIVLMLAGFFSGAAEGLLLNISMVCFLMAAFLLILLNVRRKEKEKRDQENQ